MHQIIVSALAAASLTLPCPAQAQPSGSGQVVGEIVVTAQRRHENIFRVPAAISAFPESFLDRARLDDVKDIVTFTPGFSGNSDDSYIDSLAIRGITSNDYGIGGDPSIGIFKDGVYQGRTGAAVTSLFDIAQAEALRGPQGFLFGRNAISGAISIATNKPEPGQTSGHIYAGLGSARRIDAEGAINLPIGDDWAVRVAGYGTRFDGWIDNNFTQDRDDRLMGGNKQAGRVGLRYRADKVDLIVTAEHERRRVDGSPYRASNDDREVIDYLNEALEQEILIGGSAKEVDSDLVNPRDDGDITSLTASVDVDFSFARFNSLTAYRRSKFFYLEDYDGTALRLGNYSQDQRASYVSQDFRLVSPDGRRLTWSAGLSLYRENVKARFENEADADLVCTAGYGYADCNEMTLDIYETAYIPAPGNLLVDINEVRSRNHGWSVFLDTNYAFTSALTAGVGVRYARDTKTFSIDIPPSESSLGNVWTFTYFTDGPVTSDRSWDGLTPRAYVRYAATPNLNIYASITRGFKAGGFGSFTVDAPTTIDEYGLVPNGTRADVFAPETIWSEEIGVKGAAFGGKLTFDLTAFHYRYRNLQTVFFDTALRTQQVVNVGRVIGYGVENSISWRPSRYFDVSGHLTWTRTEKRGDRDCTTRDCGGLPNPIWSSAGIATVHRPLGGGEAYLQGEWSYEGRRRESYDWRGITRRDAYIQLNLRLGYKNDTGLEIVAYVQNLLNAHYVRGVENGGDLTPANVWGLSQPRNFGVDLRFRFR
ncbi:TonB-dependent receptor [Sphingobium sp. D43FB]|uniref:TonB-dependent receptor n=1 Tax=Sphingobium sp. D43FB TaxID=2017595 RepID=UPI000BB58297|nr:TonB-dependent receptor [Sphingobium sp. D43FB]PBN41243.1 hypothetical protein SxD43FB_22900 [Sphingobium sp. D43FB]